MPSAVPDDIGDIFPRSFLNRDYFWPNLTASMTNGDAPRPFPQARVMGGGSSVMGMIALRGLPLQLTTAGRPAAHTTGAGATCCPISAR